MSSRAQTISRSTSASSIIAGQYGFRIQGSDCTIQRCVIRESFATNKVQEIVDSVGIQVKEVLDTAILGIKILDNEIYNCGDDIGLTSLKKPGGGPVEVVIEGNDLYLEESRYIGRRPRHQYDVGRERHRHQGGLAQTRVDHHSEQPHVGLPAQGRPRIARRDLRREQVLSERRRRRQHHGRRALGHEGRELASRQASRLESLDTPRDIVFRNNQFYEIRDRAALDEGAITKPITSDIKFIRNYFARSDFLADAGPIDPPGYRGIGPCYEGNILVEIDQIQRPGTGTDTLPDILGGNTVATAPDGFESYQRKRWTGPEFAKGAIPRC